MAFPVSSRGSISVPADTPDSLHSVSLAIEDALREAKATQIHTSGDYLLFRAGALRPVSGWNLLLAISSGEIRITQQDSIVHIHYRIWFVQILMLVSLTVGILCIFISSLPVQSFVIAWVWLFCGNYLLTLYRFPRFLRAAAEKRGTHPHPSGWANQS